MICQLSKSLSSGKTPATDIITYRYNDEMAYVPLAADYNQALSHARDAFPQLKGLRDASISLSLTSPDHAQKFVAISAPAWPKLVAHLSQYQIIDVHVALPVPDITITYADAEDAAELAMEPAPPYRSGPSQDVEDEKALESYSTGPRPRSPSTESPTLHRKRSWFFQKRHRQ